MTALQPFLGFALMTAYWPNISGVATTSRWIVGVVIALVWCFSGVRTEMRAVHWFGLALIVALALSLTWSAAPLDGIDALVKIAIVSCAFLWGATLSDARPLVIGAALGLALNSAVAIAQTYGWQGVETYASGDAGLFFNRDRLAAAAALVAVAVVALELPRVWLLALLPSLMLTQSRAAWLACTAGLVMAQTRRPVAKVAITGFAIGGALVTLLMRAHDTSVNERLALWHDTLAGLNCLGCTLIGHGLGSFYTTFPHYAAWFDIASTRPDHPHNELLWFAYEGGLLGVFFASAFVFFLWRATAPEIRPVLVAFGVLASFAMPLHDPATVVLVALLAGFGCRSAYRVDDLARARRIPLQPGLGIRFTRSRAF